MEWVWRTIAMKKKKIDIRGTGRFWIYLLFFSFLNRITNFFFNSLKFLEMKLPSWHDKEN